MGNNMDEIIQKRYNAWLDGVDPAQKKELQAFSDKEIEDAFFQDLSFGTAGLRGILGLGSNRMNEYTVACATQGLANYLNKTCKNPSVAVCRDSRLFGEEFIWVVASVLAANKIKSYIYPRIEPTPALSFAVRHLHTSAGINITASHNPSQYNGYKVYGSDGCQITSDAAKAIQEAINELDIFNDVAHMPDTPMSEATDADVLGADAADAPAATKASDVPEADAADAPEVAHNNSSSSSLKTCFDNACKSGYANYMDEEVLQAFIDAVANQSLDPMPTSNNTAVSIAYTPLHGAGLECCQEIFKRVGNVEVNLVPKQDVPDGNFPTCPYPNPEIRDALQEGLKLCEQINPDILIATDPDCDRVGTAVFYDGLWQLPTGNEMGALLLDYICRKRQEKGQDLSRAVAVTTIVSSTLVDELAKQYGFELRRVLTGFKYIGEQIALLEASDEVERFIFGFEESYGYMSGAHVRDKDAVNASMLIVQMVRYYKEQGKDLLQVMDELYKAYGYRLTKTLTYEFPGAQGAKLMKDLMHNLQTDSPQQFATLKVEEFLDYNKAIEMPICKNNLDEHHTDKQMLPAANVLEWHLEKGVKVILRPSGTEPKIKAYVFANGDTRKEAQDLIDALEKDIASKLGY